MKVLLGVTGSVATVLLPKLAQAILDAGHELQIVMTTSATYFYHPDRALTKKDKGYETASAWAKVRVWKDSDEWFRANHLRVVESHGRGATVAYQRDDLIPHIDLRKWADILVIAPLSANTLTKLALGLCDNLLTSLFYAWDPEKPVLVAPAMNTFMWQKPLTQEHMLTYLLCKDTKRHLVMPTSKKLACGDEGIGAMADIKDIVKKINSLASE